MPGPRNLITDVAGILIGNAADARLASGVTVALFEEPVVASGLALLFFRSAYRVFANARASLIIHVQ